jgi:hypothetical protein
MKVSGFTFLRNGELFGYPFKESIMSILPIVDEFVIALGECEDKTENILKSINSEKIKIIKTQWNENMQDRGFVYVQQKMIAQFNCKGDWAFYLEGDEIVHENDLEKIYNTMKKYKDNPKVEAIAFDYIHFYGNANTYIDSPGWYRREVRIIKNSIRTFAPDGLFWVVMDKNKKGRYPYAVMSGAKIYHYGWVRNEEKMNLKLKKVKKYWKHTYKPIDYKEIDPVILKEFKGEHPKIIQKWLPKESGIFKANPTHKLTIKEKKHRFLKKIENLFNMDLSKKHFKLVKE